MLSKALVSKMETEKKHLEGIGRVQLSEKGKSDGLGWHTILHAHIHALASLGRMGMHCIPGEEDSFLQAETVAHSLANLILIPELAIVNSQLCEMLTAVHQSQYR